MSSTSTNPSDLALQYVEKAERAAENGDENTVSENLLLVYQILAADFGASTERNAHRQAVLALEGVRTGNQWKTLAGFEQLRSTINRVKRK